jgi:hypothetical protein
MLGVDTGILIIVCLRNIHILVMVHINHVHIIIVCVRSDKHNLNKLPIIHAIFAWAKDHVPKPHQQLWQLR